ncbi:hypothetical protein GALMADRAFT_258500 [Galerina marginata CBS 339.88]|uniref:Uncharacterized protein n=1 Tax=Galerina marginata (strain CBS 339.88) TaxID=685588 RepID=A0A067SH99_GALM3|nr:hypothetical protein GALMADRAFT_258500 [Galerina marginata CBS 339.88]
MTFGLSFVCNRRQSIGVRRSEFQALNEVLINATLLNIDLLDLHGLHLLAVSTMGTSALLFLLRNLMNRMQFWVSESLTIDSLLSEMFHTTTVAQHKG